MTKEKMDLRNEMNSTIDNDTTEINNESELHFIEDLENRRNASDIITTMAIGEEGGGGWW